MQNEITRSYNQADLQQILHLAIARQSKDTEFSRTQLLEIAEELGISGEAVAIAEQEWLVQQGEAQKKQAFNAYRQGKLKKHLGTYAIANGFLMVINFLGSGGLSWSLYILLFWGMFLGIKAWNIYQRQGEEYEREFQNWSRKQQLKQSINGLANKLLQYFQT